MSYKAYGRFEASSFVLNPGTWGLGNFAPGPAGTRLADEDDDTGLLISLGPLFSGDGTPDGSLMFSSVVSGIGASFRDNTPRTVAAGVHALFPVRSTAGKTITRGGTDTLTVTPPVDIPPVLGIRTAAEGVASNFEVGVFVARRPMVGSTTFWWVTDEFDCGTISMPPGSEQITYTVPLPTGVHIDYDLGTDTVVYSDVPWTNAVFEDTVDTAVFIGVNWLGDYATHSASSPFLTGAWLEWPSRLTVAPLRQLQRDDRTRRGTSKQSSVRQGWKGTYL